MMKISPTVCIAVLALTFAAVTVQARSTPEATVSSGKVGDPEVFAESYIQYGLFWWRLT